MPIYEWKGFDKRGKKASGVVDADSPRDARVKCKRRNVLVTDVVEVRGGKKVRRPSPKAKPKGPAGKRAEALDRIRKRFEAARGGSKGGSRRRVDDVAAFTRQLATLTRAGIPITEALRAIIEQTENKRLNVVYRDVRERIAQGSPTADALAAHPEYFDQLVVSMVRAGEASGHLDEVLTRVSHFLREQTRLANRIKAAMMYPMVMLVVGVLVVALLIMFVVPKITVMLEARNQMLPLPTRILQGTSEFMTSYWWVLVVLFIIGLAVFNLIYSSPKGRLAIDTKLLRAPVLGDLLRKQAIARFAQTFSTLLASGVSVVRCLEINRTVLGNRLLEKTVDEVREKILEGADIAGPIKASGVFPPLLGYMIAVGEQSGELDTMMMQVGDAYQEEVELAAQKFTSLIEPVLILVMAVLVGFIIVSILLPVLQTTQSF